MSKNNNEEIISTIDSFGSAKNYWIAWVKDPLSHYGFVNQISKNLHKKCSYIGNISLKINEHHLNFPAYFLCFNEEFFVDLTIIPNKIAASHNILSKKENPLLGGLLFEDEYYLFNNEGFAMIKSSFAYADYIFMLSADNCVNIDEYINFVKNNSNSNIVIAGIPTKIANSQKKPKKFIDMLLYLFYESELTINNFRLKKLNKNLHNITKLSEKNYGFLRFPVEDLRDLTSPYLRREDF